MKKVRLMEKKLILTNEEVDEYEELMNNYEAKIKEYEISNTDNYSSFEVNWIIFKSMLVGLFFGWVTMFLYMNIQ